MLTIERSIQQTSGAGPAQPQTDAQRGPLAGQAEFAAMSLSPEALDELNWLASEGSPSLSRHARIILARHDGRTLSEIAALLDVDRATVRRWLARFEREGVRGLMHASAGKTRKRRFDDTVRDAVARLAMGSPRGVGEPFSHWSLRKLLAHITRRGIVRNISVEGLRHLIRGLPLPAEHWHRDGEHLEPFAADVRTGLEALADGRQGDVARRARIILARSRGLSDAEIASALGVGRNCVRRWVRRFQRHGILGLQATRRAAQPTTFTPDIRAAIIRHARSTPSQFGLDRPQWSLRSLQASLVRHRIVSKISVQHLRRILAQADVSFREEARSSEPRSGASLSA